MNFFKCMLYTFQFQGLIITSGAAGRPDEYLPMGIET
jgi:hypothetical protein